jgi:hypothetical protein
MICSPYRFPRLLELDERLLLVLLRLEDLLPEDLEPELLEVIFREDELFTELLLD